MNFNQVTESRHYLLVIVMTLGGGGGGGGGDPGPTSENLPF